MPRLNIAVWPPPPVSSNGYHTFFMILILNQSHLFSYTDNQATVYISNNPTCHERTKHINIDRHVVRNHITSGFFKTVHISSKCQLTDIFTKIPTATAFHFMLSKLGLIEIHQSLA